MLDEIEVTRQRIRESCMNLISAALGRAVGLYEDKEGRGGKIYITRESWVRFEEFCQCVRSDPTRADRCDKDHNDRAREAHHPGAGWCRTCHAGIHNFCVPYKNAKRDTTFTLIGGEYLIDDDNDLMQESESNFASFLHSFNVSEQDREKLLNLRQKILRISKTELHNKTKTFAAILKSYIDLDHELDQMTNMIIRQQRRIAHEFGTLADPIGRRVDRLKILVEDAKHPRKDKIKEILHELDDDATSLIDCVAANIPEYFDFKFEPRREGIKRILRRTASVFEGKAQERRIAIRFVFDSTNETEVEVSVPHLKIILRSLIDNAVKYSFSSGEGRQREVIIYGKAYNDYYEVAVENYGVGIESEELSRVFEAGFQGRRKAYENVTGAGLGLAMVQRYIEMHHGKVFVTSECKGDLKDTSPSLPFLTRFVIRLPYVYKGTDV